MSPRSINKVIQILQAQFVAPRSPLSLPPEARRIIQQFVEEHEGETSEEDDARANEELRSFWDRYVHKSPQKQGAFAGILRELSPVLGEEDLLAWWPSVIKPIIVSTEYNSAVQDDARQIALGILARDTNEEEDTADQVAASNRICRELLDIYVARSQPLKEEEGEGAAAENVQIASQVEDVLLAFARKRPKDYFHHLDDLVRPASKRLVALKLLSSFIQNDTPHLYLVINTPLVEDLLKCLMNDTATEVLSVALKALMMLLPHIPGSLGPYLPRLFLVYSRLLCWEKFSEFNTDAQRSVVTDDRVSIGEDDDHETRDVGFDSSWEKVKPAEGTIEAATPELMDYFTFLYGLYPLNFVSYIRKPRRYLKDIDFPAADSFDLDQAVIRSRTKQFQEVHFLHPNFYNMTIEEELADPKWPKMDPADVVGECHSLRMEAKSPSSSSIGPPPTRKLPELPRVPPLKLPGADGVSPTASQRSLRSGSSWRDTQSTVTGDTESPMLKAQDHVELEREKPSPPLDNLAYLQRERTLLQSDLNFERWHKAQYSQHIGKIFKRNVKQATVEAETLNLILANRALQKQLEQMRKARDATQKDAALTRKQANTLEANLMERFNKMKSEQETWKADTDELRRLRSEIHEYRDLLVASEARELKKSHQLQIAEQDIAKMQELQDQLKMAQQRLRILQYEASESAMTKKQNEMLEGEHSKMQMQIQRVEQDHARVRHAYATKVAELEVQLGLPDSPSRYSGSQTGPDIQVIIKRAVAETEAKLAQLKKAYSKLVADHTDLELDYQSLKTRLESIQEGASGPSAYSMARDSFGYEIVDDYRDAGFSPISASDPSNHRFPLPPTNDVPISPLERTTVNNYAGLMFDPRASRDDSARSTRSNEPAAFNQSAPLSRDEDASAFSVSSTGSQTRKEKIQPDSSVRVYGRGGAQNIKLKAKDPAKSDASSSGVKKLGLKGLRNFV